MLRLQCPGCGRRMKAPVGAAGRKVSCPGCGKELRIPRRGAEASGNGVSAHGPVAGASLENAPEVDERDAPADPFAEETDVAAARSSRVARTPQAASGGDEFLADLNLEEFEGPSTGPLASPPPVRRKERRIRRPKPEPEPDLLLVASGLVDRSHWLLLATLIPLAIIVFFPEPPLRERIQKSASAHPNVAAELERMHDEGIEVGSYEQLLSLFPGNKLDDALLGRHSTMHWLFALISGVVFLGLLMLMARGESVSAVRLIWSGVFTGTFGIMLLLTFQFLAFIRLPIIGGIATLVFLLLVFIRFSYVAALDPNTGFVMSLFGFTFGVGLCEELCKAIPVVLYLRRNHQADWRGALLVGLASGIGFGISEGVSYSGSFYNGMEPAITYFVRFVSCVGLHALWAGAVALMMYANQDYIFEIGWREFPMFVLSYLSIAMVLHGLYDTLLKREIPVLALVIAVGSLGWLLWLRSQHEAAFDEVAA